MAGSIVVEHGHRLLVALVVTAMVAAGCAGGDDGGGSTGVDPGAAGGSLDSSIPVAPTAGSPAPTDGPEKTAAGVGDEESAGDGSSSDDPADPPTPTEELGVPGLDSDEVVCRAWSRFAGSFQIVAVAAAFGEGDSVEVAELEVIASSIVVTAFEELLGAWPDELEAERDVVEDSFLGPFARRSERARSEFIAAGAGPDDLIVAGEVWLDALATRDPAAVVPAIELPEPVASMASRAATAFDAQVPPLPDDPSLVTDVQIPLTQAFLVATCPDRGALGGTEVGD